MHGQLDAPGRVHLDENLPRAVERFFTPRPSAPTARDRELLEKGTSLPLACELAATSWGHGPAVLLAHGWESRRTHWGAFVPALIESGFRAVAVDAPAHGDSPGKQVHVIEYGLKLVQVGQEIGRLAGIVGHSFGSGAAAIALHRGLAADRAVLISGPASLVEIIETWGRLHRIADAELPRFVELVAQKVGIPIASFDLTHIAAASNCPALVVHDRGDDDIPVDHGLAMAAAWPGARLLVTERYGHRRILIAREVVHEVIGFLKMASRDDG